MKKQQKRGPEIKRASEISSLVELHPVGVLTETDKNWNSVYAWQKRAFAWTLAFTCKMF